MATDHATNPAQGSDSSPAPNLGPSRISGTLDALREKWTAEPTAEELERERIRQERIARDAEQRRLVERNAKWIAFIGNRTTYGTVSLASWKFDEQHAERQRVVVGAVREFCADVGLHRSAGVGALFYGPPGTGKDHLATAIIRAACLNHGHTARYCNGVEWFVALRDSMDDAGKSEASLVKELCAPDWLVLSDPLPPVGDLSAYQAQMLYRAVDERYVRGMPTIVTINVKDGEEATKRMGGSTWDRLRGDAWVFPCNWPSHRKPARLI
jgi:DNA replication protein DnaC